MNGEKSGMRPTAAGAGLSIAERLESLKCGVAVVDLNKKAVCALLEWSGGIEEIFDVRLNTFSRSLFLSGPFARLDGTHPVWVAGPPRYDLAAT